MASYLINGKFKYEGSFGSGTENINDLLNIDLNLLQKELEAITKTPLNISVKERLNRQYLPLSKEDYDRFIVKTNKILSRAGLNFLSFINDGNSNKINEGEELSTVGLTKKLKKGMNP